MPIYEYKCEDCGAETEFMQKSGDAPKKKCPKCGGKLKKRLSAPAFHFKGSGWYITDYPKKNAGKSDGPREDKDKPKSDKAESQSEGKDKPKSETPASEKKGDSSSDKD
jgi:putative FmdB family regulatory protein